MLKIQNLTLLLRSCPNQTTRVVGFTSTFQQNVCSLALAKELRKRLTRDRLAIIFGGANCEGDMGKAIADNFAFVDHVVSGEGETVILELINNICFSQSHGLRVLLPRYIVGESVTDLDTLPLPSFDDYFAAVQGSHWEHRANLVAESSRGCWWGMKSHCTFCGLNGNTMAFRSKHPSRMAQELRTLRAHYGRSLFVMADNIMDTKYIQNLLPELISARDRVGLFYETKANLRKEQLEIMAASGVVWIQPGIESLSTAILKLMGKGTTLLQNIQLLKWAEEFQMKVSWNILFGFPGESP